MAKFIYQPKGKAREYCPWACNLYNGCSNRCEYCYNRHCQAKALLGKDEPTIKGGLDKFEAFDQFTKELVKYREQIIADGRGIHFNFVSDPMLKETRDLNRMCIEFAVSVGVPVQVLTKMSDWIYDEMWGKFLIDVAMKGQQHLLHFGFTLTGMDEQEPGADTNLSRIETMRILHDEMHFPTWASIEPVINLQKSLDMIERTLPFCDAYKVGLLSGKKQYTPIEVIKFRALVSAMIVESRRTIDLLFKESVEEYCKKFYKV